MSDPKDTAQAVEAGISHIFSHNLPLNPDSLQEVVSELGGEVTEEELQEYMSSEYGWNSNFSFVD